MSAPGASGAPRTPTSEEVDALAVLAKRGRIIAILVPEGVTDDSAKALSEYVSAQLDLLAAVAVKASAESGS